MISFLFHSLLAGVLLSVLTQGKIIIVNGLSYYASIDAVTTISNATAQLESSSSTQDADLVPLTVIDCATGSFTTAALQSIVQNYTASDDVFNTGFLQGPFSLSIAL